MTLFFVMRILFLHNVTYLNLVYYLKYKNWAICPAISVNFGFLLSKIMGKKSIFKG